jgi:PAS domain S-box-containing protein
MAPSTEDSPIHFIEKAASEYHQYRLGTLDYRRIAEDFRHLSGARYVAFNEVSEDSQYTITKVIAGIPEHIEKASSLFGFRLTGASYQIDPEISVLFEQEGIVDLGHACDLSGKQIPKALCRRVVKFFSIEHAYGIGFVSKEHGPMADLVFLFAKGERLQNEWYLNFLAHIVLPYIRRETAENDYFNQVLKNNRMQMEHGEVMYQALRKAAENTPDLFYQLDPEGIITFVNQGVQRYGYLREELIGTNFLEVVHPEDREKAKHALLERRTGKRKTRNLEVRLLKGNQQTAFFSVNSRRLDLEPVVSLQTEGLYNGAVKKENFQGTVGIGHDITEKKLLELEIDQREQLFQLMSENAGEAIWIESREPHHILFLNPACSRLFEVQEQEARKDPSFWMKKIHPEDQTRVQTILEKEYSRVDWRREGGETSESTEIEYRVVHSDGDTRWIKHNTYTFLAYSEHRDTIRATIAVDITKEKTALQTMEKQVEKSTAFIQELNHRVKNNVAILDSILHLQLQEVKDSSLASVEEAREKMQVVLETIISKTRAIGLVHEMLYKGGEEKKVNISVYLDSLCNAVAQTLFTEMSSVSLQYDFEQVQLSIDEAISLGMITSELLTNAVKYAFPDGRKGYVRISFHTLEKSYRLRVTDNGIPLSQSGQNMQSTNLGHTLLQALAEQIEGSFYSRQDEHTKHFIVEFPT